MKKEQYYKQFITTIPDFPKKGIMFRDITTVLENGEVFAQIIDDMSDIASKIEFNKIICADARGFLFGAPLGYKLHKGVVIARKPDKLPRPGYQSLYSLEYGENVLQISKDSLNENDRVLIVDDLIATGGSAIAMIDLVNQSKATPVAALFFIELPDLKGRDAIKKASNIPVQSLVNFEGE